MQGKKVPKRAYVQNLTLSVRSISNQGWELSSTVMKICQFYVYLAILIFNRVKFALKLTEMN